MSQSIAVRMEDLSFSYGAKSILEGFNLSIESGKAYCLVGSSGSGKTTTLRLINGLLTPNSGNVYLDGEKLDFSQAEKIRRTMGYSIQGSGLFPHMTLYENLTIIARKQGWNKKQLQTRVQELCELMALPGDSAFLKKRPREISGGQQQRVGIARALFMKPKIMLMDEPFSALDPITRSELQREFLNLQNKLHLTIVLVTHDLSEAFKMADEIVLLNHGKIEQQGKPSHFLLKPSTPFVKNFINSHSPGQLLKEIFLYSVVNTNVFTTQEIGSSFVVKNIDSGEMQKFPNLAEASAFLQKQQQAAHYWVDGKKFLAMESFGDQKRKAFLRSDATILEGMSHLLKSRANALPVVNSLNELIGVFSEEALDAL